MLSRVAGGAQPVGIAEQCASTKRRAGFDLANRRATNPDLISSSCSCDLTQRPPSSAPLTPAKPMDPLYEGKAPAESGLSPVTPDGSVSQYYELRGPASGASTVLRSGRKR